MTMTLEQIEQEALALPAEKRAQLLQRLLRSFDETVEAEVAQAWGDEADRRDREMNDGTEPGIPAEKVFERLHSFSE